MKLTRLAAMGAVTIALAFAFAAPAAATDNAKWFVCKYVGTPGVDESLQTGNNPISVSENAIPVSPVVAGEFFSDSQGRSYVLVEDTGQDEPDPSECPPPTVPSRRRRRPRARRRRRPRRPRRPRPRSRRRLRPRTPTPTPSPTPTPDSVVAVWKLIDEDGDPETDDLSFAAGWEFNLDTDATITDSEPVTGDGEPAWFQLKLSDSTGATVGEELQDGYELMDAWCVNLGGLD